MSHVCEECKKPFASKSHLTRHVNKVHLKLKSFKCDQCESKLSTKKDLTEHVAAVHLKLKPFQCPHCEYKCSSLGNLTKHQNAVHLKLKPFKCDQCNFTCANFAHLTRHQKHVHLKLKPFQCDQCNYTCSRHEHLILHQNSVHLQLKLMQCVECEFKCSTSSHLTRHVNAVHLKLKLFECQNCHCDAKFNSKGHLDRHYLAMHSHQGMQRQKKEEEALKKVFVENKVEFHREYYIDFRQIDKASERKCAKVDFVIEKEAAIFCVECDERQHEDESIMCETARMTRIFEYYQLNSKTCTKKVCFVRFNPHAFKVNGMTQKTLKKTRYLTLVNFLNEHEPKQQLEIWYMYYDRQDNLPKILSDSEYPETLKECVFALPKEN